jgi:hypothetical protein
VVRAGGRGKELCFPNRFFRFVSFSTVCMFLDLLFNSTSRLLSFSILLVKQHLSISLRFAFLSTRPEVGIARFPCEIVQ